MATNKSYRSVHIEMYANFYCILLKFGMSYEKTTEKSEANYKLGLQTLLAWKNCLFFSSELGSNEYGGADGTSSVARDEGFHRESSRNCGRCHAAIVLSFRGWKCPQSKYLLIYFQRQNFVHLNSRRIIISIASF